MVACYRIKRSKRCKPNSFPYRNYNLYRKRNNRIMYGNNNCNGYRELASGDQCGRNNNDLCRKQHHAYSKRCGNIVQLVTCYRIEQPGYCQPGCKPYRNYYLYGYRNIRRMLGNKSGNGNS